MKHHKANNADAPSLLMVLKRPSRAQDEVLPQPKEE